MVVQLALLARYSEAATLRPDHSEFESCSLMPTVLWKSQRSLGEKVFLATSCVAQLSRFHPVNSMKWESLSPASGL